MLFRSDQLIDKSPEAAAPPAPPGPDPALVNRAEALAERLESLASALENEAANA